MVIKIQKQLKERHITSKCLDYFNLQVHTMQIQILHENAKFSTNHSYNRINTDIFNEDFSLYMQK